MYKIPLIKPFIPPEAKTRICEVLDSGYLTEGPVTREFEEKCRRYIGCAHAIAVCNCTVGLEIALRAVGIGPGDEVIVPDYTYPATADVVAIVGAKIVLVDVERDTMLMDLTAAEAALTPRTKAVMPVSIFGNPLDYDRLAEFKQKHNILIIEDAACSIGANYRDRKVGNWADISVFSFHPRKFITTGEGGLITTSNPAWAAWMDSYKHFGMGKTESREGTVFERIGTNCKLSNLQAAVGTVQMDHINELLSRRRALAARYYGQLRGHPRIGIPATCPNGQASFQSCCVFVPERDRVMKLMREKGIEVQIGTYALHRHPAFAPSEQCRWGSEFAGSDYAYGHALALPLFHELSPEDQQQVIESLIQCLEVE
jgi:dTDP-4-amino-4,6-dideoxygalactose transaminase